MGDYITAGQLAKSLGVARATVNRYVKAGKLTPAAKKGTHNLFIEKDAKAELEKTLITETRQLKAKAGSQKRHGKKPKEEKEKAEDQSKITLHEAERRKKIYDAKIAELKFKEQAKLLIPKAQVEKEAFEMGRKLRDNILNVPGRVAHELAAEVDPHKVEVQLMRELTQALEELTKRGKK